DPPADARRLPLRLRGLLLGAQHAAPLRASAAAEPARDARHGGREREGERLPQAEPDSVGDDLLTRATRCGRPAPREPRLPGSSAPGAARAAGDPGTA